MDPIHVDLGARGYDVVVGDGVLAELGERVAALGEFRRAAVVTAPAVGQRYGQVVRDALAETAEVHEIVIPDGEEAKNLGTLAEVFRGFAAAPLNRDDLVVALGGGVIGDLAGFAAATWNRGTALVQVPTTLLAQVDSSVGGKTGVNVPEGKNLVGAFHQPALVLSDVAVLSSLPARELIAGLGEVVSTGSSATRRCCGSPRSTPTGSRPGTVASSPTSSGVAWP
jgi:3-dehydroquinate synthase